MLITNLLIFYSFVIQSACAFVTFINFEQSIHMFLKQTLLKQSVQINNKNVFLKSVFTFVV